MTEAEQIVAFRGLSDEEEEGGSVDLGDDLAEEGEDEEDEEDDDEEDKPEEE